MPQDLLTTAVGREVITSEQAQALFEIQQELAEDTGFRLSLTHLLWAGGTALILAALVLLGHEIKKNSSLSLALLLTVYAVGFALFSRWLANQDDKPRILGGCLGAAAVVLISAAWFYFHGAYLDGQGLSSLGPFESAPPKLDEHGMPVMPSLWEVLIASGLSFGIFSCVVATWYLRRSGFLPIWTIITLAIFAVNYEAFRLLFPDWDKDNTLLEASTLTFGVAMLGLSLFQDQRATMNHGFWVNKAAWLAVSTGMGLLYLREGYWETFFALVCVAAALYSVYIRRPGGVTFAAVGIFGFLSENITEYFPGIWGGILVCTMIGACLILLGMIVFRYQSTANNLMPKFLQSARPLPREDPVTFGF